MGSDLRVNTMLIELIDGKPLKFVSFIFIKKSRCCNKEVFIMLRKSMFIKFMTNI